MLLAADVAL
jgi:hypothetical protein